MQMTKHNGSGQKITADASLPDAAPGETTIRVPVTTEHVPIYTLPAAAPQSNRHPVDDWAEQITASWQKPKIEGIIRTGKLLLASKKALDRGTFISMIRSDEALPFNERTAQRLMKIAEHPVLTNATHVSYLPTSWGTLYELSKGKPKLLEARIQDGTITPRLERSEVARKVFGKRPKPAQHTLDRVKQLRVELDAANAHIVELEAARDAEAAAFEADSVRDAKAVAAAKRDLMQKLQPHFDALEQGVALLRGDAERRDVPPMAGRPKTHKALVVTADSTPTNSASK
jgi:hypothetical protein